MLKTVSVQNLAKTTHDMQNLLMLLKAHTEGLKNKLRRSPVKEQLIGKETEAIYMNIERLSKLMNSLLIYSDAKDGMNLLRYKNFDLVRMIVDLVAEYQSAFPGYSFQVKTPASALFRGDAAKIVVVLRNILENAVKYNSQTGSVISLQLKVVKRNYEIIIKDSGIGIAAQDIPKVFLPFYRGRKGINQQGSGLGLAIAQEIIQFHGGKITLQSKLNVGTEVTIVLPKRIENREL